MGEALRQWGPAALAWALVLSRGPGGAARRRVRWVLVGLACSLTAQIPAVSALVGEVSGVRDAGRLVSHAGMVFTAWAAQEFVACMNGSPRGPRWQAWWAAGAFGLMCVLFAALPDLRPQSPWVMEYCLVYAVAQVPALVAVIGLGVRHAQDRTLRVSLRLIAAGTVLGLLYLVDKSVLAVAPRAGFEFPFGRSVLPAKVLPTTAYVLVLVGAALPAAVSWLRHYRLHRGLGPLWRALYQADPRFALDPPSVPDVVVLRHLRLRVYRRVIEIRDGLLALRPHRSPEVASSARARAVASGLTGRALEAAVEAEIVAEALVRSRQAETATSPAGPVAGGTDLADDTAFLAQVSAAFTALPRR
ncbi:MAB_1171c family putative transporter [Saccharothrix stipae]